jgi:single-strand DNA-binding protein
MASNGLNRFEQIGYLADNPSFKIMPSGEKVTNFRVITNEFWIDKETKEKKERAEGFAYEVWGESAEHFVNIMKKGQRIYVEATLRNHKYQDEKTGEDKYRIRFRTERWLNLDRNEGGDGGGEPRGE